MVRVRWSIVFMTAGYTAFLPKAMNAYGYMEEQ